VYERLVDHHVLGLADLLTVATDGQDVHQALERLVDLGLVSRLAGSSSRYAANAPDVVLESRLIAVERELEHARAVAREVSRRYQTHLVQPVRHVVEVVIGGSALWQRVRQMKRATRHELRMLNRADVDEHPTDIELELLQRNVTCRTLYDSSSLERPRALDDVERIRSAGGDCRVTPKLPLTLCLIDDRHALLPLQRGDSDIEAGLVIHPSGLLDALGNLFEGFWQGALPLPSTGERPDTGEQARADRTRLETLLLSGMKEEVIARHLGISDRTVQRQVAALMDVLGASTRFQAGVQAAFRSRETET